LYSQSHKSAQRSQDCPEMLRERKRAYTLKKWENQIVGDIIIGGQHFLVFLVFIIP